MQITVPYVLQTQPVYTNPSHHIFKANEIGRYQINLNTLQTKLMEAFQSVQAQGWAVQSVMPIQGGIFYHHTSGVTNQSWGYGWGTGATEGLLLILTRSLDDQLAARWMETLPALEAFRKERARRLQEVQPRLDELTNQRAGLLNWMPKPVRSGVFGVGKVSGFMFLEQQYASEADAELAKRHHIASVEQEIARTKAAADAVPIEQYLRPDQIAVAQAVMPETTIRSRCFSYFSSTLKV